MQQMELYGKCVEKMRYRHNIKTVSRPINHKVDCECCKRRRYGGTYAVEPKKAKEPNT